MRKTIVIGLDGAHWELLNPWIEKGYLPNIKRIRHNGVWADTESCLPPVTSPNWKCYSTGKNPGKLGVFWWEKVDLKNRNIFTPRSYDYKSREIWDYLGIQGLKTAVINMPTTYPPRKINGVMIAGIPATREQVYTYPAGLQQRLEQNFGYQVHPSQPITNIRETSLNAQIIDEIYDLINLRFKVAKHFMNQGDYQFVHLTIFYINVLQHFFWDHDYTKQGWQLIDQRIGELLNDQWNLVVMSDHGSNKIAQEFYINNWLIQAGYLKLRSKGSMFAKVGLNRERAIRLIQTIPLARTLKKLIPERIRNQLPSAEGIFKREGMASKIDWTHSVALASGQGPIYLTLNSDDPLYISLREQIIQKLTQLTDPHGWKVARRVYRKEEVYSGPYLEEAPDIIIDQNQHFHIAGGVGEDYIFKEPQRWKSENKRQGLFVAYGNDVKSNVHIPKISILDIAPTLLYWMGLRIPEDMDGRVLHEIFRKGSKLSKRSPKYRLPLQISQNAHKESDEQKQIEQRLKELGYLD